MIAMYDLGYDSRLTTLSNKYNYIIVYHSSLYYSSLASYILHKSLQLDAKYVVAGLMVSASYYIADPCRSKLTQWHSQLAKNYSRCMMKETVNI